MIITYYIYDNNEIEKVIVKSAVFSLNSRMYKTGFDFYINSEEGTDIYY